MKKCVAYNKIKRIYFWFHIENDCVIITETYDNEIDDIEFYNSEFVNPITNWFINKDYYSVEYFSSRFDENTITKQFGVLDKNYRIYYDDKHDMMELTCINVWLTTSTFANNMKLIDFEI